MSKISWPAWFNGPKGETQIFNSPGEVPKGWTSGAEQLTVDGSAAPKEPAKPAEPPKNPPAASEGETQEGAETLDADGWPWSPELHAATKSLTKAGLWRMAVGVSRPAPKPGYPKPSLDL